MKFQVNIRESEGMFYATSPQMPGFLLCGKDQNAVSADILPALKLMLSVREKHQKKSTAKKAGMADRLVERREFAIAA